MTLLVVTETKVNAGYQIYHFCQILMILSQLTKWIAQQTHGGFLEVTKILC
jgi:hypothetical protein